MLGNCSSCSDDVGYFKLQDTVCNACISKNVVAKGKISRIFSFSPFWGFIFMAGFVGHFIFMAGFVGHFAIMRNSSIEQIVLSSGLMVLALVSFLFSFIIRFYVCRRRMHVALALAISFPFVAVISAIIGAAATSPASITTLGFIFFPFYILRLPNFLLETDKSPE